MSISLNIYSSKKDRTKDVVTEVYLELQQLPRAEFILLHIVDPHTGEHVTGGNLMNIYPDGTFKLIGGVNFGGGVLGFTERGKT